jgi:4-amino-4-deoxy-L-arabinose transferase-like glycosyltransferase
VLVFDGFLSGILSVFFLPAYLGSVQFPISALLGGIANVALILAARKVAERSIWVASPLIGWFAAVVLCMLGGPGGDVLLLADWRTMLLIIAGAGPAGVLLFMFRMRAITASVHADPHSGVRPRSSSESTVR